MSQFYGHMHNRRDGLDQQGYKTASASKGFGEMSKNYKAGRENKARMQVLQEQATPGHQRRFTPVSKLECKVDRWEGDTYDSGKREPGQRGHTGKDTKTYGQAHRTIQQIREDEARIAARDERVQQRKAARKGRELGVDKLADDVADPSSPSKMSSAQQQWHARRYKKGSVPVDEGPEFRPRATLSSLQAFRGNKVFEYMDTNNNGKLEPAEITAFFDAGSDIQIPQELIDAVQASNDDGKLTVAHFLLFLRDFKANNSDEELDCFVAAMTRNASPELTENEEERGYLLFGEIDRDGSGLLEAGEVTQYFYKNWPKEVFPVHLIQEEHGGVTLEAWLQYLADIKRDQGDAALATFLAGRELNFEIKAKLLPQEAIEEKESTVSQGGPPSPQNSPPVSPSLSPKHYDSILQNMTQSPRSSAAENAQLTRAVEALLMAHPTMGRSMVRRHLCTDHPHLSNVPNSTLNSVMMECKSRMAGTLAGLAEKDRARMAEAVDLTTDDISTIESRTLGFFATPGFETKIVSEKTQVSADGEVHQKGIHVSVVYERVDPKWPSLMESGTAIFIVQKPGTYNWITGETNDDWIVEPLMRTQRGTEVD